MQVGALEIKLFADIARLQSDMNKANQTVDRAMGNIEKSVNVAKRAFGGLFAGVGLGVIIKTVDEYKRFDSQLKLATKSTNEYAEAYANVVRIAKTSQSDIGAVGVLYARLTNNLRDFGTTQKEISTITEAVSLSLRVSNATVQETNSVMLQLSQSFGSGKINGQEFLAVSEGAPIIMRQLAKSLNVTYGELKNLSAEGKLTSEVLKTALSDPAYITSLREQAKVVGTISSALQVAKNNFTQYIGEADKGAGASRLLSQGIIALSDNLNNLATVAIGAVLVAFGRYTAAFFTNIAASKVAGAQSVKTALLEIEYANLSANAQAAATAKKIGLLQLQSLAHKTNAVAMANNAAATTMLVSQWQQAQAINNKLTASVGLGAKAMQAFSGIISFLGGPLGAIITLLGVGYLAFNKIADIIESKTNPALKKYKSEIEQILAVEKARKQLNLAKDDPYALEKKSIDDLNKSIKTTKDNINSLTEANGKGSRYRVNNAALIERENAALTVFNESLKKEQDALSERVNANKKPQGETSVFPNFSAGIETQDINKIHQKQEEDLRKSKKDLKDATNDLRKAEEERKRKLEEHFDVLRAGVQAEYEYNEALQSVRNNINELVEAEQTKLDTTQREIDLLRIGEKGISDKEIAQIKATMAINDSNAAFIKANYLQFENNGFVQASIDALGEQNKAYEKLIGTKEANIEADLRLNSFKLDKEQSDNKIKEAKRAQDEIERDQKQSSDRMGENLSRALTEGLFDSFKEGESFGKAMLRNLLAFGKTFFAEGLKNILGGVFKGIFSGGSGGSGGGILSSISSLFSGGGASNAGESGGGSIFGQLSGIKDIFASGNNAIVGGIEKLGVFLSDGPFKALGGALGQYAGTISKVLPYAGAVLQLLKGDIKGAAFTAIGTAIGGPIGGVIGSVVGGLFGKKKPRAKITSSRAQTLYEGGSFTNDNSPYASGKRFVELGAQSQLNDLNAAFSKTLGTILAAYGLSDTVATGSYVGQRKKTALGSFGASFGSTSYSYSQGGNGDAQSAFNAMMEAVLGGGIAQSIQKSALPASVKKFFDNLVKKEDVADAINTLLTFKTTLKDLPTIFNAIRNAIDTTAYKTSIPDLKARFAAIGTYTSLFYTAEEQFATFTKQLTGQFSALNTALPGSRGGYRALVDGINVTDLATSNLFNGLVALAPAMDAYFKQLEQQQAQLLEQTEGINQVNEALAAGLDANLFGSYADFASARANVAIGNSPANFIGTNSFAQNGNPEMLAEIKTLREEQANTRTVLEAIAAYTYDSAKIHKQWNNDGNPPVRT